MTGRVPLTLGEARHHLTKWAKRAVAHWPIVTAALAVVVALYGFRNVEDVATTKAYDMVVDWSGARAILAGYNPYSPEGIKFMGSPQGAGLGHPPTTLVWFLPLADLSLPAAKTVWNGLTLLMLFLHLLVVVRELELPSPLTLVPLGVGAVLWTSWMRYHLHLGQLSEAIAFLYVLSWYHLRRGHDVWAGALLGLACTLKFYPGAVLLYFLLGRRFRMVIAGIAAWCAIAIPVTARIGIVAWKQFLSQQREFVWFWMTHLRNASISGIVQRLHYPICQFRPGPKNAWVAGNYLAASLSLALVGFTFWLTRRSVRAGRSIDVAFALFTLVSMITGPWTWEHYDVLLILPLVVAAVALVQARRAGLGWGWTGAGFATLAAVVAMLSENIELKNQLWDGWFGRQPPSHLRLHFIEWTTLLPAPALIALLILLVRWANRRPDDPFASLRLPARAS
jgi:hypothetical protein